MRSPLSFGMFATALIAASTLMHGSAQATPISTADGIRTAADSLKLVGSVQYVWNGYSYCWYDSGWNGPGWYVCTYGPWVSSRWWGGGHGWHGWHWHGHRHVGHHVAHHAVHHKAHHAVHHKAHHAVHHKAHHAAHHKAGHHVRHHAGGHHKGGHHVSHRGGGGRGGGRRSDIRLKEGIIPLVRLNNGLELYRFRYKGGDRTAYVGVMAQEVQKIEPSAVWRDHDGYLMVNYDRIGLKFMTWKEWLARTRASSSSLP
jgi:hypothetical protein